MLCDATLFEGDYYVGDGFLLRKYTYLLKTLWNIGLGKYVEKEWGNIYFSSCEENPQYKERIKC